MGIIQRQGIINVIITYVGFSFGFINVLILYPILFTKEQFGLTRLYNDLGGTFAVFASFGVTSIIPRFLPHYTKDKSKDIIPIALYTALMGAIFLIIISFIFREQILNNYCEGNVLFRRYAYLVLFTGFFNILFFIMSTYCSCSYKTNIVFLMTQFFSRAYPTVLLLCVYFKLFGFSVFIHLLAISSLIQLLIIIVSLYKDNLLEFDYKISFTTKRLLKTMIVFSGSIYVMILIESLSSSLQVFTISDMRGIGTTAIFVVASYISQIIQMPQKSIAEIATPIISTAWFEKDYEKIQSIYRKSSVNMNITGIFLFLIICLNIHSIFSLIGKGYDSGINIAIFMSIAYLIDITFGINNEIISTSKYWKFNFITHVCLIVLLIPTNYFFIKHFGAIGAAYSLILSFSIYNTWRMLFLYHKYKMMPFSSKTLFVIGYGVVLFFTLKFMFSFLSIQGFSLHTINILTEVSIKSLIIIILYVIPVYYLKVSDDFNNILNTIFKKVRL